MELDNDTYVYGVINNKHIRLSRENWMDIWSWRENKTKPSYWFKIKPSLMTDHTGYKLYRVNINYKDYPLSRVIYKLYNKDWHITDISSDNQIDHINNNSLDNRIENLRVLTQQQNQWNRKNVRGYSFYKNTGKYLAHISSNGKLISGKCRDTAEEARADYLLLKEKYHIMPTNQEGSNHTQITT